MIKNHAHQSMTSNSGFPVPVCVSEVISAKPIDTNGKNKKLFASINEAIFIPAYSIPFV